MYPNLNASNNREIAHLRVEPNALWETEGFIQDGNMDSYQGIFGTILIEREIVQIELDPFKKLSTEADGTKTLVNESTRATTIQQTSSQDPRVNEIDSDVSWFTNEHNNIELYGDTYHGVYMKINYAQRYRQLDRIPGCTGVRSPVEEEKVYKDEWDLKYLEVEANVNNLIFDEANDELLKVAKKYDPIEWNYLRYHINTWGLSSNELFANTVIDKMVNLNRLDVSESPEFDQRTDMPIGIQKFCMPLATRNNILHIDVSNNDLHEDFGAVALSAFLRVNKSLKILNLA